MVKAIEKILTGMDVPKSKVVKDYFTGYND
jgi:hypothetical protein